MLGAELQLRPVPRLSAKDAVTGLHLLLDGFLVDFFSGLVQLFTMGDGIHRKTLQPLPLVSPGIHVPVVAVMNQLLG